MEKKIKKLKFSEKLPVILELLQKIEFLIEDEKTGISEIAKLIEKDPSLTTKFLKLANSPFYGFPKRITSVKTALNFLGVNIVKILLIVNNFLELSSKDDFLIWEHLVGVGMVSQLLAKKLNFEDSSTFYTLGLVHDIGLIVEKLSFPEEFEKIREKIKEGKSLIKIEEEFFKFNHSELGAYLMESWNFPAKLVEPILAHHDLKKAKRYLKESAILYLADLLVWAKGIGEDLLFKRDKVDSEIFSLLSLNFSEIKEIFRKMDLFTVEIRTFLNSVLY
ncbi:MAG: HDOD domain-containing protein [Thermodesulfobacteriaceae bacterium]|nr:HDOD domain-containing protein [Thermodesulfobacteriaceae bacterium]MCX8041526.1 HDOD domain-containing protein [Thermodesulfobacteriaceae bacterium]MDW8135975.1 HDOD domain-containing protein [Thermodesulfobacterium sp.]